jgi:hypothetical protein
VQILAAGPHITIFSKSKRDSTLDRYGIHGTLLEALGLSQASNTKLSETRVVSNVIAEAELVAWHGDKIDGLPFIALYLDLDLTFLQSSGEFAV